MSFLNFDFDDVDDESEDEGYITHKEHYTEDDSEWENFGLAPMIMNIARSFCLQLGGVVCVSVHWFLLFLSQLCQRSLLLWLCINVL